MKGLFRRGVVTHLVITLLLVIVPASLLVAQAPASPQWNFIFGGKVTEFNEKKQRDLPIEGCVVTLYKGSAQIQSITTDKNGKFKFKMDPNGDYTLTVTKSGYITKRFAINTYNVTNERAANPFAEFDVEIDLFKMYPGLDYSCLNQPIARIIFNPVPSVDDFDYDRVYTAQVQACIENLKRLAEEARQRQRQYEAAIAAADKLFDASSWQAAKAKYQEASAIITSEQYPKDQIVKCDEKMAADGANAANEAKYKNLIAQADAKFAAKDWSGAKTLYVEALTVKSAEQYPKDQIAKCDANANAAAAAAANEQKYKDLIAQADGKFGTKDWNGAKAIYQQASALKPAEQYPKDQIALCDKNAAAEANAAANEQKYKDLITQADGKFAAKDWAGAKSVYQQASALKSAEQYPKDQIVLCDKNAAADAANAATEQKYKDLLKQADDKFAAKDWAAAKGFYQQASAVKTAEQYPKDQIVKCDKNIADDKVAADLAAKDKQYNDLIKDADAKFAAKDWLAAKGVYQQASGIKPAEKYPKDQIALCDKNAAADANAAATDKKYNDLLKQADDKFAAKDWAGAKGFYQQASAVKTAEQYPKDQIVKCDKNIADDKAAADLAAKEQKYKDAIAAADSKFDAKDFAGAKAKYTEASGIKPSEQYPKDRIKLCDDELAKAGLDQQYNALLKQADTKFAAKDYAGAKSVYEQALAVKSNEQYPKDKIKECEDKLALAAKDKQYADLIKQADTKFAAKDFAGAKTVYQQALELKAEEQYPKDKIKACDDAIGKAGIDQQYNALIKDADAKFAAKNWNEAKSIYNQALGVKANEQYPKDKIKACDDAIAKEGVDKQYNDLIAQADVKFKASDWQGAKDIYTQASALKTAEAYPKTQIKACDDKMAGQAKDAQYTDLIKQADDKFKSSDWAGAKSLYTQASTLKATEQYPKDQIKLCDANISKEGADKKYTQLITDADAKFAASDWAGAKAIYLQASAVKSTEQYPKDQAAICDTKIKEAKEKPYNDLIAQADEKFKSSDWAGAKSLYTQASVLKATEAYPKDQIKICDANLKKEGADKKYNDLIAAADAKFDAKDFTAAKPLYQQASAVKAEEQYPKDKIKACDDEIAKMGKDKQYADLIAKADAKFNAADWAGAKTIYLQASGVKSEEKYPVDRAKLCDDNIAADAEKKYKDAIASADTKFDAKDFAGAKVAYQSASAMKPTEQYPKDRIKACDDELAKSGVDKKYNDLVKQADAKFAAKDWAGAKVIYQQATAVKGEEQYPKDQAKLCDENMASAGIDKQYNDLIKQADLKFTAKAWSSAKEMYAQASAVKPAEQYPKDRMKACDDNMAGEADKKYNDAIAAADVKFKASDWSGAKLAYQSASSMRPNESYPKDQIKICDDNLAKSGLDKQYNTIIAAADVKFKAKDYAGAKAKYQEALGVKSAEQYPKDQIKLCDDAINASLSLEQKYKNAVARGDSAFGTNDLETAQSAFTEAKNLKPGEAYPKQMLDKIAALLAADSKDRAYRNLLAKGDSLLSAKNYEEAKKIYTTATVQKPADQYPKDKLAEIKRIQDDQKFEQAKTAKYNKLIEQADAKFKAKDYKGAKAIYQQALQEKPIELYPKTQIAACDKALNPPAAKDTVQKVVPLELQGPDAIAAKYPQGKTEMTSKDAGADVTTVVVVVGNVGSVYTRKAYSWGTFYFKDGQQISENTFNYETSANRIKGRLDEYEKNKK